MNQFLMVACPVSCAVSVTLVGLVATQHPETRELLIKVGRKVGVEALRTVTDSVARNLDARAHSSPGAAIKV